MTDEQRLQMITDQLILVRDNLFRGMSKSIQKLQARSINEVLELENFTRSAPVQERNFCERCGKRLGDYIHTCTPPHNVEAKTT
jgi:hypothetical protein